MKWHFFNPINYIIVIAIFINSCKDSPYDLPSITTSSVIAIGVSNAVSGGNILSDGGAPVLARGVCWSTTPLPTLENDFSEDGENIGWFVSRITNLSPGTKYYVRAYATNCEGTAYGNERSFISQLNFSCGDTISDYNGNIYLTIPIGDECWMQQNLTVSNYNDGEVIPNDLDNDEWLYATQGAVALYDSEELENTFGKLYNFHAVNTGKICPDGWHIPTEQEWDNVINSIGGELFAGGSMKSRTMWNYPNNYATNRSGFTGLPGGFRFDIRQSPNVGYYGYWWSATADGNYTAKGYNLSYANGTIGKSTNGMVKGFSCRCIKD